MIKKILNLFKSEKNDQIGLVKFKEGDLVYFLENGKKCLGQVVLVNSRYVVSSIPNSWKVECYISYDPDKTGKYTEFGCFDQNRLSLWDKAKEREIRINQILGNYE
jgi:hypothetical protein